MSQTKDSPKSVVVYGASGYTGRLICEYLRQYQIPFIAAGRNKQRLKEVMKRVPGIETADYEVRQVDHTVEDLSKLFAEVDVVCNVVGPFEYYGETVVEAALKARCHYIDTTGEQSFLKLMGERYGEQFDTQGLVLSPSTAYMYTPLDICAHYALEQEGIDSIEAVGSTNAVPTFASTQSIFALLKSEMFYLEDQHLVPWTQRGVGFETVVPGRAFTQLAHPWGGGSLPIYLDRDPRVHNCRQLTSFANRAMFQSVVDLSKHYEDNIRDLPEDEQVAQLAAIAEQMQPGEPPRENMLVHRSIDHVVARGTANTRTVILRGGPPYLQTGVYQAATAHRLLAEDPQLTGLVSASQAVGHRYLLGELKKFLPTELEIVD
ncbi:MAG: DUF5938 domain-containing protein [Acidimicrobiales bacterium]|nr:DUF5938 domain-containing protein [Acidimicrobiales bacterium]